MSRPSRDDKREQQRAGRSALPIQVHVPAAGPVTGPDPGGPPAGASIDGVPVAAAPGQEIHHAVLDRLHRIALAAGRPVLATVHDERIGCVVPLQVDTDGSSRFTAEPVRTAPPPDAARPPVPPRPTAPPAGVPDPQRPRHDTPTHVLRRPPGPAGEVSAPTFPLRAAPDPQPRPQPPGESAPAVPTRAVSGPLPPGGSAPASPPRAVPEPAGGVAPGTVAPPTGEFGPPPPMDAVLGSARPAGPESDPDPKPTPPRGFDAVAEAVLGDGPADAGPAHLAEPVTRINEAVKAGRIEAAAHLAEQTLAQASGALGPQHPETLRLRELTAYIAYLSGDPVRAFRLSLDLARAHRGAGDAEAAYGNVQSAATAWRAVRDPVRGLDLGRDLIGLWTELAAEGGPAADDIEQLESARARMGRLTERARAQGG
ncbi:tetratricopeptide repeat protein [Streptomyces sp. NPDC051041]|uniref:tetratricopeptide repeat protein n=1 Tax=Streptomyces sp. NPDC051041 TaxID=3365640 RepID=UPI0037A19163